MWSKPSCRTPWGYRVPVSDVPRRRKSLTLGRMPADHSGATVPDFHRLPPATRTFTIRSLAALSIEGAVARNLGRGSRAPRAGSCDLDRRSPRDMVVRNGIVDKVAMPLVDRLFA